MAIKLKHLQHQDTSPSATLINPAYEQFSQYYINHTSAKGNASACYRVVYPDDVVDVGAKAARLMRRKDVSNRINRLRTRLEKTLSNRFNFTREKWLIAWEAMIKDGKRDKIQVAALEGIGRAQGWNHEKGQQDTQGVVFNISIGGKSIIRPAPAYDADILPQDDVEQPAQLDTGDFQPIDDDQEN